jgi:hypothetical protein
MQRGRSLTASTTTEASDPGSQLLALRLAPGLLVVDQCGEIGCGAAGEYHAVALGAELAVVGAAGCGCSVGGDLPAGVALAQ